MNKLRLKYLLCITAVIATGLVSRKITFIPLWIGDALWAVMIYLLMRMILIQIPIFKIATWSLAFCFAIEISQLYQAPCINHIRSTLIGHLVLGQGFLWSDLVAYTGGILTIAIVESMLNTKASRF
ncbi:DUF2809 domain-containing protein [Mucilaginibacter sp. CSA2-8R]|uniref:ribosomal maturation YjgA family protein n=1 Tax=Mucilaginibacter sp. CSA2-8R TaxID=3141542 RepID=UPI00315D28A5